MQSLKAKQHLKHMSEESSNFPCNQCGECCKHVDLLSETASMDRGDGTCINFDEIKKKCKVYDTRPDICRVDRQYEIKYQHIMTWEGFVEINQAGCKKLQDNLLIE